MWCLYTCEMLALLDSHWQRSLARGWISLSRWQIYESVVSRSREGTALFANTVFEFWLECQLTDRKNFWSLISPCFNVSMIFTVSVHASFEKPAWQHTLSLLDRDTWYMYRQLTVTFHGNLPLVGCICNRLSSHPELGWAFCCLVLLRPSQL